LYRVFAVFDDPRLPAEFAVSGPMVPDTPVMGEVAGRFDQLSASARATLEPFFVPPTYQDSWHALRHPQTGGAASSALASSDGTHSCCV
jgi:hypothetical protein